MIDLKKVRDDIAAYKIICEKKGKQIDVEAILAKDDQRKEFQQKIDVMKFQQKELAAKKEYDSAKALKTEIQ
jgi:seryl-tRNA synthetase